MMRSGFITIEFLVALAVVVTIVSATSQVAAGMVDARVDNVLADDAMQILSSDVQSITASSARVYELAPPSALPAGFSFTRLLSATSFCTAIVRDRISWDTTRERNQDLVTAYVDEQSVADVGYDCPVVGLSHAWQNSVASARAACHARVGMHSTDVVNRNGKRIVFVGGTSVQGADPDLCVYDVTSADSPMLVSSLNTGPGIFSLDAAGDYVYVVQNANSLQFQVIDVTDSAHPFVVASRSLPGVSGSFPQGRSVYVFRNRAYVGTYETAGPEFHVFDITDPRNPRALGSRAINHSIRQILVRIVTLGGIEHVLAYIASSADAAEVLILDVTNPAAIIELSHVDVPGSGSATAEAFLGVNLVVARQQVAGEKALALVNLSDSVHPRVEEVADIFLKTGSVVNGLLASNTILLLTTTDTTATTLICSVSIEGHFNPCTRSKNIGDPGRPDFQDDLVFAADAHGLTILKPTQ